MNIKGQALQPEVLSGKESALDSEAVSNIPPREHVVMFRTFGRTGTITGRTLLFVQLNS
jgi:hypothetical protein